MVQPGDMESSNDVREPSTYLLKYRFSGIPCLPHRVNAMTQIRKEIASSLQPKEVAVALPPAVQTPDLSVRPQLNFFAEALGCPSPNGLASRRSFLPVPKNRPKGESRNGNAVARCFSEDYGESYDDPRKDSTASPVTSGQPLRIDADIATATSGHPVRIDSDVVQNAVRPLASPRLLKPRMTGSFKSQPEKPNETPLYSKDLSPGKLVILSGPSDKLAPPTSAPSDVSLEYSVQTNQQRKCIGLAADEDTCFDDDVTASSSSYVGSEATECSGSGASDVFDEKYLGGTPLASALAPVSPSKSCKSGCSGELDGFDQEADGGSCSYFYDDEFGRTESPCEGPIESCWPGGSAGPCSSDTGDLPEGSGELPATSGLSGFSSTFDDILKVSLPGTDQDPGSPKDKDGGLNLEESMPNFYSVPEKQNYTLAFGGTSLLSCSDSKNTTNTTSVYDSNGNLTNCSATSDKGGGVSAGLGSNNRAAAQPDTRSSSGCPSVSEAWPRPASHEELVAPEGSNGEHKSCGPEADLSANGDDSFLIKRRGRTSPKRVSFVDKKTGSQFKPEAAFGPQQLDFNALVQSATWQKMKDNFTTWGQVKTVKESPRKSRSVADIEGQCQGKLGEEAINKRHSLTLFEIYKRTHSQSSNSSTSDSQEALTSSEVFSHPKAHSEEKKYAVSPLSPTSDVTREAILTKGFQQCSVQERSVVTAKRSSDTVTRPKCIAAVRAADVGSQAPVIRSPDLGYLRPGKSAICRTEWWCDIQEQPSFCHYRGRCQQCGETYSTRKDGVTIIVKDPYEAVSPGKCSLCSLAQKHVDESRSSGVGTGSSGVTPKDGHCCHSNCTIPECSQRKAARRESAGSERRQSAGSAADKPSLPTAAEASFSSDRQLIVLLSCMEAADALVRILDREQTLVTKLQHHDAAGNGDAELLQALWKLSLAIEGVVMLGMRDLTTMTTKIGKVMTRLSAWDVATQSAARAGPAAGVFAEAVEQARAAKADGSNHCFCLFVCALVTSCSLDFWLQAVCHDVALLDRCYSDDAFLRQQATTDRKLFARLVQSLVPLTTYTIRADCKTLVRGMSEVLSETAEHSCHKRRPVGERLFKYHAPQPAFESLPEGR